MFNWLGILVFSSSKGGALFSGHQGPKNWGTCFEKGCPCKHEHEGNTGLFGGCLILAKDSTEKTIWNHGGFLLTQIAVDEKDSIVGSIPADLKEKGSTLYASLIDMKGGLQTLIKYIKEQDPDMQNWSCYRLTGRGTIELTIEKADGSTFSPEAGGEQRKTATIQVVLDGYSAPLTAGNFTEPVIDGAYDGAQLSHTDQAVLTENGLDKIGYNIPLEIMPSGQFEPLYRTTLSVQDGELPVLPLSIYGAVAMAHSEDSEDYSAPYQFFLLFI